VIDYSPSLHETLSGLGARARRLRIVRKLSQAELAIRAGIGVATVHRFEKTGTASIENVLRIAAALNAEAGFDQLFAPPAYASLDDALADERTARKRAPKRS
jgi:transcriptional regulator with XRE-family HTH domain